MELLYEKEIDFLSISKYTLNDMFPASFFYPKQFKYSNEKIKEIIIQETKKLEKKIEEETKNSNSNFCFNSKFNLKSPNSLLNDWVNFNANNKKDDDDLLRISKSEIAVPF